LAAETVAKLSRNINTNEMEEVFFKFWLQSAMYLELMRSRMYMWHHNIMMLQQIKSGMMKKVKIVAQ
jgi:hypothetical protein